MITLVAAMIVSCTPYVYAQPSYGYGYGYNYGYAQTYAAPTYAAATYAPNYNADYFAIVGNALRQEQYQKIETERLSKLTEALNRLETRIAAATAVPTPAPAPAPQPVELPQPVSIPTKAYPSPQTAYIPQQHSVPQMPSKSLPPAATPQSLDTPALPSKAAPQAAVDSYDHDQSIGAAPPPPTVSGAPDQHTGALDQQVIAMFQQDCRKCHGADAATTKGGGFVMFKSDGAVADLDILDLKNIATKVALGEMPKGNPYDASRRDLVKRWDESRAQEFLAAIRQIRSSNR